MGTKLSPPLIAGTIPAFYSSGTGIVVTIPFSMNRVVSPSQVSGFAVKIRTTQSGTDLYANTFKDNPELVCQNNELVFTMPLNSAFRVGQFYKIQLAYVSTEDEVDEIGYYSTVAVSKYTTMPTISINNLTESDLNSHLYTYEGIYNQGEEEKDITERVYSYRFNLYNSNGELIDTSGDLLHNSEEDDRKTPYLSKDTYTFTQELLVGEVFRVSYTVTTINGLIASSPRYRITQKKSISPELNADLKATLNYDNGYVNLRLESRVNDVSKQELTSGSFILARSCEDTDYMVWEELYRFKLVSQVPTLHLCKDFTVEQGKYYKYSIQQYNDNGLYSNRIVSTIIYVDFEDAFLFDGKRQLKIKYNPKMSSFKKDLLETKTDTIGGKHPFIFRNGRVYYSEFPISGLISYQMDEENLFLSKNEFDITEKTTNLTGDNIAAERIFKMKVLEWLTNGEPKVFRSPTEGNYIVRLMNSSLSPNDTLGRMLHTFTSTAYEVADFNYSTLGNLGFIHINDEVLTTLQWETIQFKSVNVNINLLEGKSSARTIRFNDMVPGDIVRIKFKNTNEYEEIKIGRTGSYYIDTGMNIDGVILDRPSLGTMTYSYEFVKPNVFNTVSKVEVKEIPAQQFVGEHDILQELLYVYDTTNEKWVKNPKLELVEVYRIDVEKRPLQRVKTNENNEIDPGIDNIIDNTIDPFLMYEVGTYITEKHLSPRPGYPQTTFTRNHYYDAFNNKIYDNEKESYDPYLYLNKAVISVNEIGNANYVRPGDITEFKSGNGVLVNIAYQMCHITYNLEDEAMKLSSMDTEHYLYKLRQAIDDYNHQMTLLKNYITNEEEYPEVLINEINAQRTAAKTAYDAYILELVAAQGEDLRRRGVIE